jgi:hypothetical protein
MPMGAAARHTASTAMKSTAAAAAASLSAIGRNQHGRRT